MTAIPVRLGERSYEVRLGAVRTGLGPALARLGFSGRKAVLVTTQAVRRAGWSAAVERALRSAHIQFVSAVIADGERQKTLSTVERLYALGLRHGLDRKSVVVAVGGGVTTDLAGFFASTYMRGIAYASVPTTLLGMVDASIGGKTGVDLANGKNLVGTFWQPRLVWIDPAVLSTLPAREWRTGFAEVLKYGVICDARFFAFLERGVAQRPVLSDWTAADRLKAIRRSAEIKAAVVSADERETPLGGGREILNFGHTAGHALESATDYRLSHGEAISVGMAVAGRIALGMGLWSEAAQERMTRVLTQAGLPTRFPRLSAAARRDFWNALRKDKKHVSGQLRFVLPERLGRVRVQSGVPTALVDAALRSRGF